MAVALAPVGGRPGNWDEVASFVSQHHDTYPYISPDRFDLSGKSVFITGASKGLGKTTAIHYAKAGAAKIAIAARSDLSQAEKEIKAAARDPNVQVLSINLDVTSEESTKKAAAAYKKTFGDSLDVLIANAGYLGRFWRVGEGELDEWWKAWEVNIKGTYLTTRHFMEFLLNGQSKLLITLSSAGAQSLLPGASAYQTTKFAVCRLTEFVDHEYSDKGVIAIAIHPGSVKTELALTMPEYMHSVLIDTPELPADTMVWMAAERREWLAGRFLSVNWDMEELEKKTDEIVQKNLLKFRMNI
ncbi:hypothetical protein QBC46DRAFT_400145 [Diplogelasinospora grovesii]|uniref:NAD-P-binding protein n=1 Tax=Diplogelasinospora grovesii TaxID=303347 RepID=A0AAN6RZL1_9PEZI|nr:hypothetical protein QBC46DRAFT_400145 [Diplogelasinospora grovesii]